MNIIRWRLSIGSNVFFDVDFVFNYDILIILTRTVPIVRLLVILLGECNAAGSFSPMLRWLIRILFNPNLLVPAPWFRILLLLIWWLGIYIRHCKRIICVNCPIVHGCLLVLNVVLDFAGFVFIIQRILPWAPNVCLRRRIWSLRLLLLGLRRLHVPPLVEVLDILVGFRRMPRLGTHWSEAPLGFTRVLFGLHFYTLLRTFLVHLFTVDWLH